MFFEFSFYLKINFIILDVRLVTYKIWTRPSYNDFIVVNSHLQGGIDVNYRKRAEQKNSIRKSRKGGSTRLAYIDGLIQTSLRKIRKGGPKCLL